MNIVFWSPYSGTAVSSSALAMALVTAIEKHIDCSIMQLHYSDNGLFNYFMPETDSKQISMFENTGIDALLRSTRTGVAPSDVVRNCSFAYLDNLFNAFSGTKMQTEKVYQMGFLASADKAFAALNDTFRLNFIDTPAGVNSYSDKALLLADLIVVCLPQTIWKVTDFFKMFSLPPKKVVYMLSDFDKCRTLTPQKLTTMSQTVNNFGKNVISIPHNPEFANSIDNHVAIQFFLRNSKADKFDSNYEFINSCKKSCNKLLKLCGYGA